LRRRPGLPRGFAGGGRFHARCEGSSSGGGFFFGRSRRRLLPGPHGLSSARSLRGLDGGLSRGEVRGSELARGGFVEGVRGAVLRPLRRGRGAVQKVLGFGFFYFELRRSQRLKRQARRQKKAGQLSYCISNTLLFFPFKKGRPSKAK
jgi:hypothetical protein